MIRRSETRRERIAIRNEQDGSVAVVNGLGVPVRRLWVAANNGQVYEAADISAGASAVMAPVHGERAVGSVDHFRKLYGESWLTLAADPASRSKWLRPGCYLAVLDSSPFIEEGIQGVGNRKVEALVYGIMRGSQE
jgi:hypothetical protein